MRGAEKKQLYWFGGTFAVLLILFALSSLKNGPPAAPDLSGVVLPTLDGSRKVDLGACAGEQCLTVYVSPWCGICRRSTPFIKELKGYLARREIETRIVVGRGESGNILEYAPEFGEDVLIDMSAAYPLQGGVPNFAVSKPGGEVVKVVPGVPGLYKPPFPEKLMIQMGRYLGLF